MWNYRSLVPYIAGNMVPMLVRFRAKTSPLYGADTGYNFHMCKGVFNNVYKDIVYIRNILLIKTADEVSLYT